MTPTKIRFGSRSDDIDISMKTMEIYPVKRSNFLKDRIYRIYSADTILDPWLCNYTTQEELRDIIFDEFV